MAMGPESSSNSSSQSTKHLHNFDFPCELKWGNQRFLRCMKVNSNGEISTVQRRSSSAASSVSNANANKNKNTNSNSNSNDDFISIIGKRKDRLEKFKDQFPIPADVRRGSDYKKAGLNFKLPPHLSSQQQLPSSEYYLKFRSSSETGGGAGEDGIAAVREKLMFDLQTAADKMKDAILHEGLDTEEQDHRASPSPSPAPYMAPPPTVASSATVASSSEAAAAVDASICPWNLRTRRAACKAPPSQKVANGFVSGGAGTCGIINTTAASPPMKGLKIDVVKPNSSPLRTTENNKSPRLKSGGATSATPCSDKKERVKFSVPLTKREMEEDFLAFANRRPPRRPQKRPKYVQKQFDTLFPGLWLTEITADMYKVPETQQ